MMMNNDESKKNLESQELFLYNKNYDRKNDDLNIWFIFPSIYSFGMSSLGYLALFKSVDELSGFNIERIFTDSKMTQMSLKQIKVLGFSMSFEMDFLSILKILEKYNLQFKSCDRKQDDPIIFAGGPVLTANPEPFCQLFDFIIIGDGETVNLKALQCIKAHKSLSKQEILEKLSTIDGIYIPCFTKYDNGKVVKLDGSNFEIRKVTQNLKEAISTPILTHNSYFSNTFIIEIVRGCPQRCGFCLASYLNLPTRFVSLEKVLKQIEFGLKYTNKIALLGALISAHPDFDKICDYLLYKIEKKSDIELSISSLRIDAIDEKIVKLLTKSGQKHATVAIEAGTDRLRKIINKNLKESQILDSVKIAKKYGLKGFKFYAMIGLPTETFDDIEAFIRLAKKIKQIDRSFDMTFSFSTFIPKANTPFQFCVREDQKSLEKKYEYLKKQFHKLGIKIRCSSVKWDDIQTFLSRADRNYCDYLIQAYKLGSNLGSFKTAFKNSFNINSDNLWNQVVFSKRDLDSNLPWDFIRFSTSKQDLIKEYLRLIPLQ